MNNFSKWWGTPQKLSDRILNRKISWLELFSDLAYVVMLHSVITNFAEHYHELNLGVFVIFYLLLAGIWSNFSLFFDLHGDSNARTLLLTLVQIFAVLLMITRLPFVFAGDIHQFIAIYLVIQVIIIYIWTLVVYADPEHFQASWLFLVFTWLELFLLIATFFVDNFTVQMILLAIVVISKYTVLLFNSKYMTVEFKQRQLPMIESEALEERYGEFSMIILGEAMAIIVESLMGKNSVHEFEMFTLLAFSIIGIWWIYYTVMSDVTLTVKHYFWIELFHTMHHIFFLLLVMMLFFMYLLLEDPARNVIEYYSMFVAASIIMMYIIRAYSERKISRSIIFELIVLLLVSLTSIWLPVLWVIGLVNLVIAGMIFHQEWLQIK